MGFSCLALFVFVRKSVRQRFHPDQRMLQLMESFRQMTNICIRIGLENDVSSLKRLSLLSYRELHEFPLPSAYKLCAISKATGILSHYRKLSRKRHVNKPYCSRINLTTCYRLAVRHGKLHMPGNLEVPLNTYVRRFLSQQGIEVRSVNLTPETLSVSVRKHVQPTASVEMIGIDRNLDNITVAGTDNLVQRYDLTRVTAIKSRCRATKRRFHRNDVKTRKRIFVKYGRLERDRVGWLLHNVSANIVLQAKLKRQTIVMEDLRGIRRLYRRGNGQGSEYRSRMNSWSYGELQRQIHYKAEWNGVPVFYVRAFGTSAKCSKCGHHALPEEDRQLHCPNCNLTIDRDVNGARNIVARGLRFKPVGSADEAMVQEPSRCEVLLRVDADQSASKLNNEPTS
jgi:putative transposase